MNASYVFRCIKQQTMIKCNQCFKLILNNIKIKNNTEFAECTSGGAFKYLIH